MILNRGKLQGSWKRGEISRDELVQLMAGGAELDQLTHELQEMGHEPGVTTAEVTSASSGDAVARRRIGVGLIGFGWLGQAHSRSMQRIRTLFPEREFDPELVICSDTVPARVDEAMDSFGYRRGTDGLAPGGRTTRRSTWCSSRAQRDARGADRGGRAGRQGRVLREARGRHARRRPPAPSAPRGTRA